jgi:hypothetical protein
MESFKKYSPPPQKRALFGGRLLNVISQKFHLPVTCVLFF